MSNTLLKKNGVVVIGGSNGYTVISGESPLTRLHYFDGKFLRAADLNLEQRAFLNQVRLSNQAGGPGVVRGFSCTLSGGDRLEVSPGLAIDPAGRILNLPEEVLVGVPELIEKSSRTFEKSGIAGAAGDGAPAFGDCELAAEEAPETFLEGVRLYLVTAGHAEAYCGEEDVYGKLCEEACISDTERPYIIEGVVIRAVPLDLPGFLPASQEIALSSRHFRSRVASAYFEAERSNPASLISGEGLSSPIWCLGAEAEGGVSLPLAVVAWDGTRVLFLDSWIARREKMETPPWRYWAGRMAMRPWNVFLAHVLQFQCQLAQSLSDGGGDTGGGGDPCEEERSLAGRASEAIGSLLEQYSTIAKRFTKEEALASRLGNFDLAAVRTLSRDLAGIAARVVENRFLINRGIVELPSAGYLPVSPGDEVAVNEQVRRFTGEGVDLRFCVVRPDFVPHALEEARHMDRISLLEGIDDPSRKPEVDVLVPDGRIEEYTPRPEGIGYEMDVGANVYAFLTGIASASVGSDNVTKKQMADAIGGVVFRAAATAGNPLQTMLSRVIVRGAARGESTPGGGHVLYFAGRTPEETDVGIARNFKIDSDVLKLVKAFEKKSAGFGLFENAETVAPEKKEENAEEGAPAVSVSEVSSDKISIGNISRYKRVMEGLRINVPAGKKPFHALWIELRTDLDPFSLERGQTSPVSAGTYLVASLEVDGNPVVFFMEGRCSGWLYVENKTRQGSDTSLVCRFKAQYSPTITVVLQGTRQSVPFSVKLNEKVVVVRREGSGARPAVSVNVPDPSPWRRLGSTELVANRQWRDGENASSTGYIQLRAARFGKAVAESMKEEVVGSGVKRFTIDDSSLSRSVGKIPSNSIPLFSARQKLNADVLLPENKLHGASLSALALLEAALEDKGFADIAARQLFPPPKKVPDELKVFARRDWVLFHRRRRISCGYDVLPEPLVKPRRFRVFNVSVNGTDVSVLRQAFLENQSAVLGGYDILPHLATVEYEAGIQSLRTDPDDIRAEWQSKVDRDVDIRLAMVATRGAAYDEGPDLARARLNSLVQVLSPVVELDEEAELLYASRVPDLFSQGDIDGVVLFVTLEVRTICHHVYRFQYPGELLNGFLKKIGTGGREIDMLLEAGAKKIGYTPYFRSGTGEFHGETTAKDLQKAWGDAGDDTPYRAVAMVRGGGLEDQPLDLQARKTASAVGSDIDDAVVMQIDQGIAGCPAITLLATEPPAEPVFNDVISWFVRTTSDSGIIEKLRDVVEGQGLPPELDGKTLNYIGRVEFDPENVPDSPSLNDVVLNAVAKSILGPDGAPFAGQGYRILSVSRKGASEEDVARDKAQAGKVAAAMHISEDVATAINGNDQWPVADDGSSITCIVVIVSLRSAKVGRNIYGAVENAPDDVVASITEEIGFDESGKVIRDLAFHSAVRKLKKDGIVVKSIEMVTTSSQLPTTAESGVESLLAALKEAGVAAPAAKVRLRVADTVERKLIARLGTGVTSGLVLRK